MSTRFWKPIAAVLLLWPLFAAQPGVAESKQMLKFTHGMTVQSLAGRSDLEIVELSNGRHVSVGLMRHLDSAMQAARAPKAYRPPLGFTLKPATNGAPVRNANDLAHALKTMHDNDTVQLPSGRRVTVAQIKLLEPLVEQRTGHKLDVAPAAVNLTGPSIKIKPGTSKAEWQSILAKPDNTVLESPTGVRVTVGGIKQYMAATPLFPLGESRGSKTPVKAPQIQKGRPQ
jgi:hypothetical protein